MSIWKTPDQTPDQTKEILVEYVCAKGTPYYKVECGGINNMFHPKRWAYLSDIIAQADKAERLQKAITQELDIYYSPTSGLHPAEDCVYAVKKIIGYKRPKETTNERIKTY